MFPTPPIVIDTFAGTGQIQSTRTSTACFCTGTHIFTELGPVAVEYLNVGDVVITVSGQMRPVKWIGSRSMSFGVGANDRPVRIAAHAFGVGMPVSDLYMSPGHPVLVGADDDGRGGYLVPILNLVNGTTIRRHNGMDATYWHVELDEHDVLLAEGLPVESYLDWGDRAFFQEGSDFQLKKPGLHRSWTRRSMPSGGSGRRRRRSRETTA